MSILRHALQGAINSREATLRNGRCQRKDYEQIWVSIGRTQTFLNSYPAADDVRVRAWCLAHLDDVMRIVPGNQPRVLAKLIHDQLKMRSTASAPSGNDEVQLHASA